MLGPLPRLYRVVVSLVALTVFAVGGAWSAVVLPHEILVSVGASIGLAVGVVCAFLLLHESPDPHGQRLRRHRLR